MNKNIENDLKSILTNAKSDFFSLKNSRIFITGGTGFIGSWILESLNYANRELDLNILVTVISRNPKAFLAKNPHFKNRPHINFIKGNVLNLKEVSGEYTHLIHAATDASAELNENNPREMFDTVVCGTQNTLDFAVKKNISRVLFLSSGAIYGQQPWEMEHISEEWAGSLDCTNPMNTYAEAKRAAEMLCSIYEKQYGLNISIARIFALLGPFLPIDTHFAAGNFIKDAIEGKPIIVKGNGLPCRSYLYASDLTIWLWRMLVRAESGKIYNVGSDESISIGDLARRTSETLGDGQYTILNKEDKGWNLGRYVPDTSMIKMELNVSRLVSLDEAIYKTAYWNGWRGE